MSECGYVSENELNEFIDSHSVNLNYYTYDFFTRRAGEASTPALGDGDYMLFLGDISQPVYEKLAKLLDMYYIDIDTVMTVGGLNMNDRYYYCTISIPPLSERSINKIMEFFNYTYYTPYL